MGDKRESRAFTAVAVLFLSALVLVAGFAVPFVVIVLFIGAGFDGQIPIGFAVLLFAVLAAPFGVAYAAVRDGVSIKLVSSAMALSLAPGAFFWLFIVN